MEKKPVFQNFRIFLFPGFAAPRLLSCPCLCRSVSGSDTDLHWDPPEAERTSAPRKPRNDPEKRKLGPMRRAFIARNPLLRKEQFVSTGLDPLVQQMNKYVKFSLLDNPGKYTVRVASFQGDTEIEGEAKEADKPGFLPLPFKSHSSGKLEEAADNAHRLTIMLREQGVEAYEFHDRCESIVTVGSFDSVGQQLPNGKLNLHPAVYQIMRTYGAAKVRLPLNGEGMRPKDLGGIEFDLQPMPIEVPRRSLASDYAIGY